MKIDEDGVDPGGFIDVKSGNRVVMIRANDIIDVTEIWLTPAAARRLARALEDKALQVDNGIADPP